MSLWAELPPDWQRALADVPAQAWWPPLAAFVAEAYARETVFPPRAELFQALHHTPFARVRVVILGQDPYPGAGQAHGLSFSVRRGQPIPRSLQNIYRERQRDLGLAPASHGCLEAWAAQGVLLLNTVLTVRAGASQSHAHRGWEHFSAAILAALNTRPEPLAFVLWGQSARAKKALLDAQRHLILESAHPSPLSARQGFWGSQPFSRVNSWLQAQGLAPLDWDLPD
jgi:uracil-DNA glycosylase